MARRDMIVLICVMVMLDGVLGDLGSTGSHVNLHSTDETSKVIELFEQKLNDVKSQVQTAIEQHGSSGAGAGTGPGARGPSSAEDVNHMLTSLVDVMKEQLKDMTSLSESLVHIKRSVEGLEKASKIFKHDIQSMTEELRSVTSISHEMHNLHDEIKREIDLTQKHVEKASGASPHLVGYFLVLVQFLLIVVYGYYSRMKGGSKFSKMT